MKGKSLLFLIGVPVLILALIVTIPVVGLIGVFSSDDSEGAAVMCGGGSLGVTVNGPLPEVAGYDQAALERAVAIVKVGEANQIPARGQMVALMVAMQESDLGRNPSTASPDGNGDAGVFQQRQLPGWYGTLEEVNDVSYAAGVFYKGKDVSGDIPGAAGPNGYHIPGLLDIEGWDSLPPTVAAQRVQRSAYPDAYAKHENKAREILSAVSGVNVTIDSSAPGSASCAGGGGGGPVSPDIAGVIEAGKTTMGARYDLGSGGWEGPTNGAQDCSGLTTFSYQKALGIHLPRTARAQWAALKSNAVDPANLQPGDLIFEAWGSRLGPGVVSHVAIYIGDGQMLEASRSAGKTQISPARTSGYQFVGAARVPPNFAG